MTRPLLHGMKPCGKALHSCLAAQLPLWVLYLVELRTAAPAGLGAGLGRK
jgi:hypothetical protein